MDFPIKNGDFPLQNVTSPEGNQQRIQFVCRVSKIGNVIALTSWHQVEVDSLSGKASTWLNHLQERYTQWRSSTQKNDGYLFGLVWNYITISCYGQLTTQTNQAIIDPIHHVGSCSTCGCFKFRLSVTGSTSISSSLNCRAPKNRRSSMSSMSLSRWFIEGHPPPLQDAVGDWKWWNTWHCTGSFLCFPRRLPSESSDKLL